MTFQSATIVVPTRNRPETLAVSVRSILRQAGPDVNVLVSDNSTDPDARDAARDFCALERVRYVRPPEPLPMPAHWAWALDAALGASNATHFAYLTDRMAFKDGELPRLLSAVRRVPDKVVSYNHDAVDDREVPAGLQLFPWTGKLFEVDARHLLYLSSRGVIRPPLPRMLNSIAPRAVLDAVASRFGAVFGSISPDFCFTYRCLDTVDSIVYYDKPLIVQFSMSRSQGASYARGEDSPDRLDFASQLGETQMNYAAPVPQFQTIRNAIFHEYCFVKAESGSGKFPEVDPRAYMAAILEDFSQIESPALRREMLGVLRDNGWVGAPRARYDAALGLFGALLRAWSGGRSLGRIAIGAARRLLGSRLADRAARAGIRIPPGLVGFGSAEDAIAYANRHPLPRTADSGHIEQLFEPPGSTRELPFPEGDSASPAPARCFNHVE
ncbi:MAG TPA: glycosyltransferase family 2 protein [Solirubrobacterales bacterium]|nr:glycosyltransferase family 2 protein [Solirubrobacterales bacterium]